jgi:8-oxo-dGTP pyrophosphatase MutT (NUDIX family)
MELRPEIVTAPPRDAATVVLLRDTAHGLEVFLVQRHAQSDVLGGAYVFPGGKLDASDVQLATDAQANPTYLDQPLAALHAALGEPALPAPTAAGLYVAALRETREECGVRLTSRNVLPWSRWITPRMPSMSSKRFDTRFFVATMPEGQHAQHDMVETTASVWLPPRHALERYWHGDMVLAPPQIMSLAHLARHTSVATVLAQAQAQHPPLILPEAFDEAGERVICYPGDARHSVPQRALPGPTRVVLRRGRFEPVLGFEGWWD